MSGNKPQMPRPEAGFWVKAFCLLSLALAATSSSAWVVDDKTKPKKLFKSEDTLVISMTAPWREFVRNEDYKGAYPATLEYTDDEGNPQPPIDVDDPVEIIIEEEVPPVIPEASTLILLGSAATGLVGYASLQIRARRRKGS